MWQYSYFFHWSIPLPGWFQCLLLLPKILQCVVALVFCCDMKIKLWCKITIDNFYLKIIRKDQIKTNLYFSWKLNGYCHKALLYLFCIWCAYNENKPKFLALLRTLPKLISSHIDIGGGYTAPISHRKYHFIFFTQSCNYLLLSEKDPGADRPLVWPSGDSRVHTQSVLNRK